MSDPVFNDYADGLVVDPWWFDDDFIEAVHAVADSLPGTKWGSLTEPSGKTRTRLFSDAKQKMQEMAAQTRRRRIK